mmetsp:Transcript_15791/g.45374  ORF Transcript_15791/g.45374 Transcript_15791/m.45374 type:complete len:258 (+) Transcript_15791:519-1292(+)
MLSQRRALDEALGEVENGGRAAVVGGKDERHTPKRGSQTGKHVGLRAAKAVNRLVGVAHTSDHGGAARGQPLQKGELRSRGVLRLVKQDMKVVAIRHRARARIDRLGRHRHHVVKVDEALGGQSTVVRSEDISLLGAQRAAAACLGLGNNREGGADGTARLLPPVSRALVEQSEVEKHSLHLLARDSRLHDRGRAAGLAEAGERACVVGVDRRKFRRRWDCTLDLAQQIGATLGGEGEDKHAACRHPSVEQGLDPQS